jgi:mRNA interferase MazF
MKNFDDWNKVKQNLDKIENVRTFKEREVWWCSIGVNVGSEIYGKGKDYVRPVLVLKKFNKFRFVGIPLTSKTDDKPNRHLIEFNKNRSKIILDQARCFDARRLLNKEAKIGKVQFNKIKGLYTALFE